LFWIAAGIIIGAYITGVQANGTFNPLKWNWGATWGQIALGAAFGAISGGAAAAAGKMAATFAASSLGIHGGVLGGAIGGLGTAVIFGESIGRSIVRGMISGAIGGAVIGGAVGGIQQGIVNAKPGAIKGNIWTGKAIAPGRGPWALNNAPKIASKTPTVGKAIPKVGKLTVGEMTGEFERTVGYKIDPQTEQFEAIKRFDNSNILSNTSRQLQAKFKHAGDFGVTGNYSKANASNFSSSINQHINSSSVRIINGTYRGQPVIHYINPNTGLNVISNSSGQFISAWKLNPEQLQNILKHGGLDMKANNENRNIVITFSEEEALVLLEWLHNFNKEDVPNLFQDQAEERILFDLEAELEKVVSIIFDSDYQEILSKARQKIRDEE